MYKVRRERGQGEKTGGFQYGGLLLKEEEEVAKETKKVRDGEKCRRRTW